MVSFLSSFCIERKSHTIAKRRNDQIYCYEMYFTQLYGLNKHPPNVNVLQRSDAGFLRTHDKIDLIPPLMAQYTFGVVLFKI